MVGNQAQIQKSNSNRRLSAVGGFRFVN